jgi:hypothetical protein
MTIVPGASLSKKNLLPPSRTTTLLLCVPSGSKNDPVQSGLDRIASVRCGFIGPGSDYTVGASGVANEAARPISAVEGDAHLGDGVAHDIVHARPAEGILPFEAGNATAALLVLTRRGMDLSSVIQRCDNYCDAEQECYPNRSSLHLKPPSLIARQSKRIGI